MEIFEKYLREEKKASANTLSSYLRDIRQLGEYLDEHSEHGIIDADEEDLSLLRSVVFASMDFIKWLVMKLKERNDKSANEYNLWESVSEGTSEDCA